MWPTGFGEIRQIGNRGVDGIVSLQLTNGHVIKAKTREHVKTIVETTMVINVTSDNALLDLDGAFLRSDVSLTNPRFP